MSEKSLENIVKELQEKIEQLEKEIEFLKSFIPQHNVRLGA